LQLKYRQTGKNQLVNCLYSLLPETKEMQHAKEQSQLCSEKLYKEGSKKDASCSLYAQMPQTIETVFAKELTKTQSDKFYKEKFNREKGKSSFTSMKMLPEVAHATEVNKHQSNVNYRKGKEELHHFSMMADRPDIISATNAAKLASDVSTKSCNIPSMHWVDGVIPVLQVKYKEGFDKHLKGQRPHYNPLECLSFKHIQAAAALASQVKYKASKDQKQEGSSDLPNLLQLEHALYASKLQSNVHYKKKYEQTKAQYHLVVDTAEQLHHKENAVLHSQVKYREEFERSKGSSQMEFGDTEAYRVSKEAQKMQSEKVYRKDLEQEVKGRGLSGVGLEETPELLRVKNANQILNEKHYRKDLEKEIVGKGMELSAGVLEIQRAKRASEIQSEVTFFFLKDTERFLIVFECVCLCASLLFLKMFHHTDSFRISSTSCCKQLRENSYGTVMDTPDLLHASYLKDVYSQKKYKDEAERLKGRFCLGAQTPEMERVKSNQQHISSVQYREEVGSGTAVTDTPEMERVRRNQENISSVKYKQRAQKARSLGHTPELERVKQNQENISLQEVKGRSCTELDTPEYRRVRRSQEVVSMVAGWPSSFLPGCGRS
uniref:Nebulette n=1 Tax=Takifugu rubripes TaxID=31033 RepID=A0A3B5JZU9_TAKRU